VSLYLIYSDPHICDRAPSSCTDSYTDDLFDLLEQVNLIAVRRKVKAVICAGDFWHLKSPSRTSHRLVQRAIRLLQSCPVQVYIVPGNHDITSDRLDSIHQTQPLGVLFESGAARCLQGWAEYDGPPGRLPLYGVPWLQGYGDWGAYDGDDPHPPIELSLADALREYRVLGAERPVLVVAHAPLYPPGKELKYEYFPAERWAEAMGMGSGPVHGYVFYGHVHEPHGTYGFYDAEGGITFCNNGALSRGSLHEHNLTREVGCTLWDSETGEFEFVPLDAKPASEVFRLQEKQQVTDMQGRLDDFLASVGSTTLEAVSVESVIAHIRTLGLSPDEAALAEELLAEAAHGGKG
jgi:hypothetical protein